MIVEPVRTWSKRCDAIFPCPNAVGRCHRVAWINVLLSKWGTNNFWLSNEWHLMRLTRKKWSFFSTSSSFSYRWWYFSIEFCVAVFRITSQLAAQSQRLMDCWLPQLFPMEVLFEDQKHIAWFLVEPLLFFVLFQLAIDRNGAYMWDVPPFFRHTLFLWLVFFSCIGLFYTRSSVMIIIQFMSVKC